jgi:NADH dehydrogenase
MEDGMILVVGATGRLGQMITRRLLVSGREVRILVRPGSQYQGMVAAGAQPVSGDLRDDASLRVACQGVDTIITTAVARPTEDEATAQAINLLGYRRLIDAAQAADVKHFTYTSVLAADPKSPAPFVSAKGQTEAYLKASGIPYTILKPDIFMDVWIMAVVGGPALKGQPVWLAGAGSDRHSFVATQDVAAFAVAAADNPAAIKQSFPVGGPQAFSWRDAVAAFERELGRIVPVQSAAPFQPIPGLPDAMTRILWGISRADTAIDMTRIAETFGVTLTPLEELVRAAVAGARAAGN